MQSTKNYKLPPPEREPLWKGFLLKIKDPLMIVLSMGDDAARAKEASDITIIDNSFASICKAILWGRSLYINIRRFILFQITINVCACLIVLFGAMIGEQSPLTVTQMLWVNLIMDTFAAMGTSARRASDE